MSAPIRVQLSRAKGWRMPANTVKVDRTTGFGNPFPIAKLKTRSCGVDSFKWLVGTWTGPAMWILDTPEEAARVSVVAFLEWARRGDIADRAAIELRGKNLACWCKLDAPCHADVLLELAAQS